MSEADSPSPSSGTPTGRGASRASDSSAYSRPAEFPLLTFPEAEAEARHGGQVAPPSLPRAALRPDVVSELAASLSSCLSLGAGESEGVLGGEGEAGEGTARSSGADSSAAPTDPPMELLDLPEEMLISIIDLLPVARCVEPFSRWFHPLRAEEERGQVARLPPLSLRGELPPHSDKIKCTSPFCNPRSASDRRHHQRLLLV